MHGLVGDQVAHGAQPAGIARAFAQQRGEGEAAPVLEAGKTDVDLHRVADPLGGFAPVGFAGDFHHAAAARLNLGVDEPAGLGIAVKLQHRSTP